MSPSAIPMFLKPCQIFCHFVGMEEVLCFLTGYKGKNLNSLLSKTCKKADSSEILKPFKLVNILGLLVHLIYG